MEYPIYPNYYNPCSPSQNAFDYSDQTNLNSNLQMYQQDYTPNQYNYNTEYPSNFQTQSHYPSQNRFPSDPNISQDGDRKKVSGDSMPHPITSYAKDYQKYVDQIYDVSKIQSPPPTVVLNSLIYNGEKNSSPRYIRSSLYLVPESSDLLKRTSIPFAVTIVPFALDFYDTPKVDFGESGPVRCRRCRAYVNPHVQFVNGGKNYRCNICDCLNDVPDAYFCNLDQTGVRLDIQVRPELLYGTYDLTTNLNYCRNNLASTPAVFIFMIDVSYYAKQSGMLKHVTSTLISLIDTNPSVFGENGRIGIMAYDTRTYIFCPGSEGLKMEIVNDVSEPFTSSLNHFIVNPNTCKQILISLLQKIPAIFDENRFRETIFGPVIYTAIDALLSLNACGKIMIFHTTLPSFDAPGKLKHNSERVQLGTDEDKKLLSPQDNYYSDAAQKCADLGISVDMFLCCESPIEIPTILPLCSLTGGNAYFYKFFTSFTHGSTLSYDLTKSIRSASGFDAMAKLRCSNGLNVKQTYGNFLNANGTEIVLSCIDPQKCFVCELCYDDKLTEKASLQFAILYTSKSGERLIRVLNLCLPVVTSINEVFKGCDQDALISYFTRYCCKNILKTSLSNVRKEVLMALARILASYRQHCASGTPEIQLIMPDLLKLMPLFVNSLFNLDCVGGGCEITPDDKSFAIYKGLACTIEELNVLLYPRLFDISSLESPRNLNEMYENYSVEYFQGSLIQIRCSYERLDSSKIYLLENGSNIFIWLGSSTGRDVLISLFGTDTVDKYIGMILDYLPSTPSTISQMTSSLIDQIRKLRDNFSRIYICQQGHKSELIFKKNLMEDRGFCNGSRSYVEFLRELHFQIRESSSS